MPLQSYTYDSPSSDMDGATAAAIRLAHAEREARRIELIQQDFQRQQEQRAKEAKEAQEARAEKLTAEAKAASREVWLNAGGTEAGFNQAWPKLREQQLIAIAAQAGQIAPRDSDIEIGYGRF